jgi:transcriptional regulator with XRE-family HTH domain
MADFLVMDRSYLSEIETGKKDPSLTMLKTIADGLSISLTKLIEGL